MGGGITSLSDLLFYKCSSLGSVTVPANVTSIGKQAFQFCGSLTNIAILNGVTNIGNRRGIGFATPNVLSTNPA